MGERWVGAQDISCGAKRKKKNLDAWAQESRGNASTAKALVEMAKRRRGRFPCFPISGREGGAERRGGSVALETHNAVTQAMCLTDGSTHEMRNVFCRERACCRAPSKEDRARGRGRRRARRQLSPVSYTRSGASAKAVHFTAAKCARLWELCCAFVVSVCV